MPCEKSTTAYQAQGKPYFLQYFSETFTNSIMFARSEDFRMFFSKFLAVLLMFFCAKNYGKMCQSSYFPTEDWKFLEITITSYSK